MEAIAWRVRRVGKIRLRLRMSGGANIGVRDEMKAVPAAFAMWDKSQSFQSLAEVGNDPRARKN